MNLSRRTLLNAMWSLPLMVHVGSANAASGKSSVKPRHVLCFLGGTRDLAPLSNAVSTAIAEFAPDFGIDNDYSRAEPDTRMDRSFDVCWDRVEPGAWTEKDEDAVSNHKSVLYVLGPQMTADNAVTVSATALLLVEAAIKAGAVAVKGESAGVAHGLARWRNLIEQGSAALESGDNAALSRICRLAFSKRPLSAQKYLESVGFHLVGLPEIYVAKAYGSERQAIAVMDSIADDMAKRSVETVLRERRATLSYASSYKEDDFKFNPYGIARIERR